MKQIEWWNLHAIKPILLLLYRASLVINRHKLLKWMHAFYG